MAENPKKRPRNVLVSDCTDKKRPTRSAEGLKSKKESDERRRKTRVTIGVAFPIWRALKKEQGLRSDTDVALLLLNSYLRKSENRPEQATIEESSSTESCYLRESENHPEQPTIEESSSTESSESVHEEYPLMMCSENEIEQETCAAPSVQSSENGKESGKKDAACQRPKSQKERTTTSQSENKENRDIQEDENEEFSTSLSVGDGRYLVDLGSSSEFVIDEECLFQLFKSCRECNRQCTVRKRVTGLKLVVSQACCFCQSHSKWTNLPDDDDDGGDLQINGKQTALEQTNSAKQ
ncbi:uncharacterized protein LOC114546913 isoform X1 [Perca flavescens]|uniref:uncharacterized protein LOC114546913 isoform X1 n=1 Tax=Perca flavescens TaxID=8167 RepID=UPI00106E6F2B|nr:uncharacterized protein LOC114546913 isoform X1 [Perca flavescens]